MSDPVHPPLSASELRALARTPPEQCRCPLQACRGWDSVSEERWPASQMRPLGSLRQPLLPGQTEATFEEYHPGGTRYESPQAPIAPAFFPFNRCDVFGCALCGCAVLRYTEYGGYYVDHRARLVEADRVVPDGDDSPP